MFRELLSTREKMEERNKKYTKKKSSHFDGWKIQPKIYEKKTRKKAGR